MAMLENGTGGRAGADLLCDLHRAQGGAVAAGPISESEFGGGYRVGSYLQAVPDEGKLLIGYADNQRGFRIRGVEAEQCAGGIAERDWQTREQLHEHVVQA